MTAVELQRTADWYADRAGLLTASMIDKLMRGRAGSRGWATIMKRLAAEAASGTSEVLIDAPPLRWGRENEAAGTEQASLVIGAKIKPVGFIRHPSIDYIGASPDGDIPLFSAVWELKCPWSPEVHQATILADAMPEQHAVQVHVQMMVMGYSHAYFGSYDPRHPDVDQQLFIKHVLRDDALVEKIEKKCADFWAAYQEFLSFGDEAPKPSADDVLARLGL